MPSYASSRPTGRLIWATYLGGPGYDRPTASKWMPRVTCSGRALGRGFPTTPGSFQPTFQGYNGGGYGGYQNAFVARLSRTVQSSSGPATSASPALPDIALDAQGDVYLPLGYPTKAPAPVNWFCNKRLRNRPPKGKMDCGAIKVSNDGSKYYGRPGSAARATRITPLHSRRPGRQGVRRQFHDFRGLPHDAGRP